MKSSMSEVVSAADSEMSTSLALRSMFLRARDQERIEQSKERAV